MVVALSRYAGLRTPSEVFGLRSAEVDLPGGRLVVRSPETERHAGGASRVVPIFPDLKPYLADAFDRAGVGGAGYVVTGVVERGRADPWPKSLHNMRASLGTELMQRHPIHVV